MADDTTASIINLHQPRRKRAKTSAERSKAYRRRKKASVPALPVTAQVPATKADIAAERAYMIDLHQQVLDLVRSGQSWDELYRHVHFADDVRKWTAFDTMHTLNILGMYRWVSNHRRGEW